LSREYFSVGVSDFFLEPNVYNLSNKLEAKSVVKQAKNNIDKEAFKMNFLL